MPRTRVAVIGAGISGLGVARALERAGVELRLLEAGDEAGGVIRSERTCGYLIEHGPNSALNTSLDVERALGELGLLGERVFAGARARKRFIVRAGRPVALPMNPLALLATPLWSGRAKCRLLAEPFASRPPAQDETVADFVTRRLGPEMLDYAVDPFVSGVYAGDPHTLSIRSTFPTLYAWERDHGGLLRGALARIGRATPPRPQRRGIYSFRDGMAALPRAIAVALGDRMWPRATVRTMTRTAAGFRLAVERDGEALALDAERVVVATPADRAADMLRALTPALAEELQAIRYAPIAVVFVGLARDAVSHPLDGFGCLVPWREGGTVLGSLWSSSLFPARAPEGMVALTNYLGGARRPELPGGSDDQLTRQALHDLARWLGVRGPAPFVRVIRHARGIPQYSVGHDARVARIDAAVARVPGLSLTGNYLRGVAVGDCFHRGLALGRAVADSLRA